jgi:hypothetical protein
MTNAQMIRRIPLVTAAVVNVACNETANPTAPTAVASPVTVVYESQLYPRGAASRTLAVAQSGTVILTLTSVRPDQGIELGVGLGIPRADGGGCHLSQSVSAVSGSATQLSANVDAGTYCVKIFDLGTLANEVSFAITIVHP